MLMRSFISALIFILSSTIIPNHSLAKEAKKLIFLHYWTGDMSGGIDEMAATFNRKNPEYEVKASGFEHETFKTSIKVMLEVGNPPDLFSYWAGARTRDLVDKGYLLPIDDVWEKAGLESKFGPAVSEACTYNGKKYAIPLTQHYVGFFYNKAIFQKNDITPPKTLEELVSICEKLKKNGITPISLGSREKWPAQFWFDYILLKTAGPDYRQSLMEGKASYKDPQVINAFKIWNDLLRYFNKNPNLLDWAEASKMVYNGEAAMTLMGTWIIGQFETKLNWRQEKDYDFFEFPAIKQDIPEVSLGPIDCILLPKSDKTDAAKPALEYFSDVSPQEAMSKGSGALSPNKTIPDSFYSPMQLRIIKDINKARFWAFNYDLATPPPVAEAGLDSFYNFLKSPEKYREILDSMQTRTKPMFEAK